MFFSLPHFENGHVIFVCAIHVLFSYTVYIYVLYICVSSWYRYADSPGDLEESSLRRYAILSCDNKKNTRLYEAQIYLICLLSVIQTGFVETLKPQFVPGQVMAGSAAAANVVEEKLSHLQLVQENDNLKSQVKSEMFSL